MSGKNEEVLKLKNKIIECQEETLQLLHEKHCWPDQSNLMEQKKQEAVADLTRHSFETSVFENELKELSNALKHVDKVESNIKERYDRMQARHDEYTKFKEKQLIELESWLETVEEELSVTQENRVQMEKRIENLNVFCEAMYSTLELKKSTGVSLVKEAQKNGQKMRERRGSKKPQ